LPRRWLRCEDMGAEMKRLKITTLDKGWHDKDEVLLHAAFQLLADFVEEEQPDKIVDWNADELHKSVWEEITGLYKWWTKTRPKRRSPLDDKKLKQPPFSTLPVEFLHKKQGFQAADGGCARVGMTCNSRSLSTMVATCRPKSVK